MSEKEENQDGPGNPAKQQEQHDSASVNCHLFLTSWEQKKNNFSTNLLEKETNVKDGIYETWESIRENNWKWRIWHWRGEANVDFFEIKFQKPNLI